MQAASSPVVALWLWCRSGRFTVPPWAVYMPARQPAQPGHAVEKKKVYLHISLALSHIRLSFFFLSLSPISSSLSFSSVLHLSSSPLISLEFLILKSVFSFFLFFLSEPFVLQGWVNSTLVKLYSQPDSLQHSGGGSVSYKTFRCARGWLKLGLLLCFAELLSSSFFFTLPHLLFPVSFTLDATPYSKLWNGKDFFSCVLQ